MNLIRRQYETPDDYWRLREFFRRLTVAERRTCGNWHVCDFDYWRWHFMENVWERPLHELRYWQEPDGRVVAVLVQGEPGVVHPTIDPERRTEQLLNDILEIAESEFMISFDDGRRGVFPWVQVGDEAMIHVLTERGFVPPPEGRGTEHYGWQSLTTAPVVPSAPAGYAIRSMGDRDEYPSRSLASWRAFHPGEPDEGADPVGAWYANLQRSPSYRRDLDVVAIDEETGDIAAFATGYFDDVSRSGIVVLVGTAPRHQRKGLGKIVVSETIRCLHWLGARSVGVTWSEEIPGLLYQSCGFRDIQVGRAWRKLIQSPS